MTETLKLIDPATGEMMLFSRDGDLMYIGEDEIRETLGREIIAFAIDREGWIVSEDSPSSLKDFMRGEE